MRVPDNKVMYVLLHEAEQVSPACFRVDVLRWFIQTVTFGQRFRQKSFQERQKALSPGRR
jgi:hypothetical protein